MVNDLLPRGLSVLVLCGVIAAIMSTCADQILAVTGAISVDIVQKVFNVNMNEKNALIFSKLLLASVGVATFLFALNSGELVMNMVSFAWSGMGSSLGPVVLLTMLDRKSFRQRYDCRADCRLWPDTDMGGNFIFDGRRREVRCVLHRFVRWHPREQADSE